MKATIIAKPHFQLTLTKDIVDLLRDIGEKHYDATCREACRQGGFLWGWMNCVKFGATCGASFSQLDLTLKILENYCGALKESRISLEYTVFVRKLFAKSACFSDRTIEVNSGE